MNDLMKKGAYLLGSGVVMRILAEVTWPIVKVMSFGSPLKMPLLVLIGFFVIAGPLCLLGGVITLIIGAIKKSNETRNG